MANIIAVGLGGFVGAVMRYLVGLIPTSENSLFPVKTFAINVIGSMAIGCIAAIASKDADINPKLLLFLKVGVCGGFTTFSTFALETTDLIHGGHAGIAFLYAVLSILVGCIVILGVEMMFSR